MLTKDLMRMTRDADELKPGYLKDSKVNVALCEDIIDIFESHVGEKYGDMLSELEDFTSGSTKFRIIKGLAHCLDKRIEFSEENANLAPELRKKLFEVSAETRDFSDPKRRDAIIAKVAENLRLPAERIDDLLYADLKEERKILDFRSLDPKDLIALYNLALAQTVLLNASYLLVRIKISDALSKIVLHKIMTILKFRGLLFEITHCGNDAYKLFIDGPNAVLTQKQKYGFRLALFLPSLFRLRQSWDAHAEILLDNLAYRFELSPDAFRCPLRPMPTRLPERAEILKERLLQSSLAWSASDTVEIIRYGGQKIQIPDLSFTHKVSGANVNILIFEAWESASVQRHIDDLLRSSFKNFVIVACEKSSPNLSRLKDPRVVLYKNTVRPAAVLSAMENCLSKG